MDDIKSLNQVKTFCVLGNLTLLNLIENNSLVRPFAPELVSSNGIDLRLADEYFSLQRVNRVFDTHKKNPLRFYYRKHKNQDILIRPDSRILVSSLEQLKLPDNITAFVGLRSSYARLGLQMPVGFVDPGFVGNLTFEISGCGFPVLLHAGEAVVHVLFAQLEPSSKAAYKGRYQNQQGVTLPIFP